MTSRHLLLLAATLGISITSADVARAQAQAITPPSDYLYVWTASADSTKPDFLAVLDARPDSRAYGRLLGTVVVPGTANHPHHTEHEMAADNRLFANGFGTGKTFIFDMNDAEHPRLDAWFGDVAGMMHPHSFVRLPNGRVLATFQMRHDSLGMAPGGIAELTTRGDVMRFSSADLPGVNRAIRPYSAAIVTALDRIVTTTTDMVGTVPVRAVQVWRLSDLRLLTTIDLPQGPRGDEAAFTAEPRVLGDGRSLLVSTFNCGLYLLTDVETTTPHAQLVTSFPRYKDTDCAVPVLAGNYYLITVPAWHAVVSLDVRDPTHPREVSRVTLGKDDVPHWIAMEPNQRRVVITGYEAMRSRVMMATFDPATGQLALDQRFRDDGASQAGVRFDNKTWPHGGSAAGIPHGAVFNAVVSTQAP